jgi:hypothetical protein
MRLEMIPLILGGLLGLVGFALLVDAWTADSAVAQERRSRPRRERDRFGEALVGLGIICIAAALVGRDTWRYTIVVVILGAVILLWGTKRNRSYLRDVFIRGDRAKIINWQKK